MQGEGVTRTEFDDDVPPSYGIIEALREHTGKSIVEMEPPLQRVIDAEAANRIVSESDAEIRFEYQGCRVRITSDGTIEVESVSH